MQAIRYISIISLTLLQKPLHANFMSECLFSSLLISLYLMPEELKTINPRLTLLAMISLSANPFSTSSHRPATDRRGAAQWRPGMRTLAADRYRLALRTTLTYRVPKLKALIVAHPQASQFQAHSYTKYMYLRVQELEILD